MYFIFLIISVRQVTANETDIVAADLSITEKRLNIVDFSVPILDAEMVAVGKVFVQNLCFKYLLLYVL